MTTKKSRPKFTAIIPSPLGHLGITLHDNKLSRLDFLSDKTSCYGLDDPIIAQLSNALENYFDNPQHSFTLPLQTHGTPFQISVWQALCRIPVSSTISYKTLAETLHTSPRAIGNACRANPIPIIIPCHRVVAQHHIGGYAGKTSGNMLDRKKWLLQHENAKIKSS